MRREVGHLAARIWTQLGGPTPPPRDLEPHVSLLAPLVVVTLPQLTPTAIARWLVQRQLPRLEVVMADVRLHGALVATALRGLVFVDASLDADERRVVVAHEFAHYLLDVQEPQQQLRRRVGATPTAWSVAWVGRAEGSTARWLVGDAGAETHATRLAYELLAPAAALTTGSVDELVQVWGFPPRWATHYARSLAVQRPFASHFGLS